MEKNTSVKLSTRKKKDNIEKDIHITEWIPIVKETSVSVAKTKDKKVIIEHVPSVNKFGTIIMKEKKRYVTTKSKLGTTKSVKSKTTRKIFPYDGSTTSLPDDYSTNPVYPWPKENLVSRILDKILWWLR